MTRVNARGQAFPDATQHVLALLGHLNEAVSREVVARGGDPVPGTVALRLRPSQLRLLELTPAEGMRVTDLATRAGMSKQALGELAGGLEERGLLETVRDPADRRVRILRPTPGGRDALRASRALVDAVEAAWRERVGAATWESLRRALVETIERAEAQATTRPRSTTREGSPSTDRSSAGLRG